METKSFRLNQRITRSTTKWSMVTNGLQHIYKFVTRHFRKKPIRCLSWNTLLRTPTVADDVTLISNDPYELQSMLDIQTSHANSKRYLISEQKWLVRERGKEEGRASKALLIFIGNRKFLMSYSVLWNWITYHNNIFSFFTSF